MAGKKDYQAPNVLQSLKTTALKKEEGGVGGTGKIRQDRWAETHTRPSMPRDA